MRIGITCYPTYGGSGAVATELGIKLADRGHEVHFISYAQPFRLDGFRERVFFHEVEMDQYPLFEHSPYSLALAVAIHETADKHDLDLVHAHYAIPHATSAWIAREMLLPGRELPIVTTLHGTDITLVGIQPSFQSITRFSILRSQGLTAVSEFLREETVRGFGVPRERIRVIPNFIDTTRYFRGREPCHRNKLAPSGEKIVMHISNFRPVKRVTDVIEVFARLVKTVRARLVLVGDGPERPRAMERAEELGIEQQVLFLGKAAWSRSCCPAATSSCFRARASRSVSPRSRRWPAAPPWSLRASAGCPRSSPRERTDISFRSATWTAWRPRRRRSSRMEQNGAA